MRILFLTTNPNLCSTTRILQGWLTLGRKTGLQGNVVVQRPGDFAHWLADGGFSNQVNSMPLPNRRWPFPALWQAWKIVRWARRQQVQIIHCNEHDIYPFALLLKRLLGLPLVCHVRFLVARGYCEWAFGNGRTPDALFWTSQKQRDDCAAAVADLVPQQRQHLVPLGLDVETFGKDASTRTQTRAAWGFSPDEVVIGTASALRPIKRIEDFITLVAKLAGEDQRVVGVIAGDAMRGEESHREKLLRQIQNTGLGNRLKWLGNLEPIEPFHHAIDVFVSTSNYETFGNSVCEAMACGKPVAAYRGGSVQEVVGDAGRIVETGDLPALTAAVNELVCQPALRADLGERSRRRVAVHFNPRDSFKKINQIYDSLLPRSES